MNSSGGVIFAASGNSGFSFDPGAALNIVKKEIPVKSLLWRFWTICGIQSFPFHLFKCSLCKHVLLSAAFIKRLLHFYMQSLYICRRLSHNGLLSVSIIRHAHGIQRRLHSIRLAFICLLIFLERFLRLSIFFVHDWNLSLWLLLRQISVTISRLQSIGEY